ncbi:MAG TPA: hypothetical protein VES20_24825 [Bryobacteraceae bacterium]|nr:hypothetical protein [Bryobacteraceae bacterium]
MTIGVTVLARSLVLLSAAESTTAGGTLAALFGAVAGALLMVGFFTMPASVVTAILCAFAISSVPLNARILDSAAGAFLGSAIAASLVLLGPGAFSADARLFGPREIKIAPAAVRDERS